MQQSPPKPPPHKLSHNKPKIRAVTAFIRLDRAKYESQIQETLKFLRAAKSAFEKSGYEVEGIRITTQPFPEYTQGMSTADALAFFRAYDALAVKEGFDASIGPAMTKDSDDPRNADLLAQIIANSKILEGSVSIAGEDGIHWKSIHATAGIIEYLAAHTAHSQGNFNFTAAALVPPNTPFYPASFTGEGKHFAIALQSANVVADVFASTHVRRRQPYRTSATRSAATRRKSRPPQNRSMHKQAGNTAASISRLPRSKKSPSAAPSKNSTAPRSARAAPSPLQQSSPAP